MRTGHDSERQLADGPARSNTAWDLPIRLFHWCLMALVAFSWWSASARMLDWHRRSGLAILILVLFRILWGYFGSATARFTTFVRGPRRVLAYVRSELFSRNVAGLPGHNPLGGWSVLALLAALLLQTILGLFAVDVDGIDSGPLSSRVSFEIGRLASKAHGTLFDIFLGLAGLHVAAVLFHLFYKRSNLIRSMLFGWLLAPASKGPERSSPARALLLLVASAAVILSIVAFGG